MRVQVWSALAIAGTLVAACSEPTSTEAAKTENPFTAGPIDTGQPAQPKVETPPPVGSQWSYDTDKDEMRGTTSYFASVRSDDTINLGFPYEPDTAELILRKQPSDGQSVILRAPGQFICHSYRDDTVAVKFDNGPIQQFECGEPADATTGVLFIRGSGRFIEKAKSSKRVIIEVPMYQAGRQQITFDVEGLEWPPKSETAS